MAELSDVDPSPCPFTLIEEGNQRESYKDFWGASKSFYQASRVLHDQSHERLVPFMDDDDNVNHNADGDGNGDENTKQEKSQSHARQSLIRTSSVRIPRNSDDLKQMKIAALYQDKSWEYYHKAREMFIAAMNQEWEEDANVSTSMKEDNNQSDTDDSNTDGSGSCRGGKNVTSYLEALEKFGTLDAAASYFELCMDTLSKEILMDRQQLFHDLFLGAGVEMKMEIEDADADVVIPPAAPDPEPEERTLTLEERLASLNSSLPSKLKSEDERMKDLQSGLDNLGVFVPSATTGTSNNARDILMNSDRYVSEEDQIAEIMAMAKDEAMLDAKAGIGEGEDEGSSNDVRELLKKASIRIDLDEEHYDSDHYDFNADDDDDDEAYANDPEMAFWKNAISPTEMIGNTNGIGNINVKYTTTSRIGINNNDNDDEEPKTDIDKMRKSLVVAQQMLLQAKLCLDEYEEQQQQQQKEDRDVDGNGNGNINSPSNGEDVKHAGKENDAVGMDEKTLETKSDGDQIESHDADALEDHIDETFNIPAPPTTMPSSRSILTDANDDEELNANTDHEAGEGEEEESDQEKKNATSKDDDEASKSTKEGLSEEQVETVVAKAIAEAQQDQEADNDDDEDDNITQDQTNNHPTNPLTKMGRDNLQEAQSLLQEVLQLWPQ